MIALESVSFSYPGAPPLVQGLCLHIEKGDSCAILGPSGCGKTTLLYLLAGLKQPQAGEIRVGGRVLTRPRPETGLILQDYGLLPWATALENAELGLRIRGMYGPDGKHAPKYQVRNGLAGARRWLERLGLGEETNKYPGQLSGGQRQRVAIARTLSLQPDLLLMDEPFSSLDDRAREDLQDLVSKLWQEEQLTLVIVTHTLQEAAALGRHVMVLSHPPITKPTLLENPGAGRPGHRASPEFARLCQELRDLMRQ